jgi:hypothetical protein
LNFELKSLAKVLLNEIAKIVSLGLIANIFAIYSFKHLVLPVPIYDLIQDILALEISNWTNG